MNTFKDQSLLYQIAKYYYIDELSQQEICQKTNISRPQISRMLKKARDLGIVQISVTKPDNHTITNTGEHLKKAFHFKEVLILPSRLDKANIYRSIAEYLSNYLIPFHNIGIGWNKSIYNASLNLNYQEQPSNRVFYPLIGSLGVDNPFLQSNNIVDRFAERFQSHAFFNNYPALIDKETINQELYYKLENIQSHWKNLDCAVIGIGGKIEFNNIYVKEIPMLKQLNINLDNVIGGILGRFFFEDDKLFEFPDTCFVNSIDLSTLKKIPTIIGIGFGVDKIESLYYCAVNNYYNILITDDITAQRLLAKIIP